MGYFGRGASLGCESEGRCGKQTRPSALTRANSQVVALSGARILDIEIAIKPFKTNQNQYLDAGKISRRVRIPLHSCIDLPTRPNCRDSENLLNALGRSFRRK